MLLLNATAPLDAMPKTGVFSVGKRISRNGIGHRADRPWCRFGILKPAT
jgi:hypothetical protein